MHNPYSSRPRGSTYWRSAVGGRDFCDSQSHSSPYMKGAVPQHRGMSRTTTPEVMMSNSGAEKSVEPAHLEQQRVAELASGDCGGGDFTSQPKPPDTSDSRKLAPSVARLFSSVSRRNHSTRDDISELLDVWPQGVELSKFCHTFETCFHRPFDSRWSDVSNLRQMLEHMVDLVECIEHGNDVIVKKKCGRDSGTDYFEGNTLQL